MTWILGLLVIAWFLRKRAVSRKLVIIAGLLFLVFSNTVIYHEVLKAWEGRNLEGPSGKYDAVVVLGGFSSYNERHEMVSFNCNSDRYIEALKLYHTGVAKKLLISGGSGSVTKPEEKESLWMRGISYDLGVKESDLIVESNSRNTHENAVETARMLNEKYGESGRYLLITSAFHMRRARACFEKSNLNFQYYRVDFVVDDGHDPISWFIPSGYTLDSWQLMFKEWIGYVVYWMKDYL